MPWPLLSVEELAAPTANALSTGPFGSAISSKHFRSSGVPVIRGSNLSGDIGTRIIDDGLVFVDEDLAKSFSRSIVRKGDLVFTCWGTVDQVGLIDDRAAFAEYVISNKQMKFTPDTERADPLFLYYFFSSREVMASIRLNAIGSSVPGFNLGQLRRMTVPTPSLFEQQAIAAVLSAIDDKIEANRRMNATLEALARALFKSWFGDFDPVRAKMEGRDLAMAPDLAALFPDALVEGEIGEAPAGWEARPLGASIHLEYGKALKEEDRRPGRIAVYGSNGQVGVHDVALSEGPGIVVGRKGNPGTVEYVSRGFWPIDTTFYVTADHLERRAAFWWFAIEQAKLPRLGADSAVPGLNRQMALAEKVVVPTSSTMDAFCHVVQPLIDRLTATDRQSATLAQLRDLLLPKLLSGALRVRDAERLIGDAA